MDRGRIVEMLHLLAERCEEAGLRGEIHLVGGAAIALAFNAERSTGDLDGAFEPKTEIYRIAASIADEQGLDPDWLNDGAKAFIPASGEAARTNVYLDAPGLVVRTGSAKQLFVMKAVSGRDSDIDDLRLLYRECGFADADEALDLLETTYPPALNTVAVQHIVRSVTPDAATERSDRDASKQDSVHARLRSAQQQASRAGAGKVWVPEHTRNGKRVPGYWRKR